MIKHCTLIEWPNSITSPQWSRQLSQPTLWRGCEKAKIDKAKVFVSKGENKRSRHQRLFKENFRKTKKVQNMTSKLCIFAFHISFLGGSKRGCPCSYISSSAMRNSDLFSSLSLQVCVLH